MSDHIVPAKTYWAVFTALLVGTFITVEASKHDFGLWNTVVAMAIAATKASLVIAFFMHVKYAPRLIKLLVAASFAWLILLLAGTSVDYYAPRLTPEKQPPTLERQ